MNLPTTKFGWTGLIISPIVNRDLKLLMLTNISIGTLKQGQIRICGGIIQTPEVGHYSFG